MARYTLADTVHSPLLVFYEVTRACDLACRHCRACAMPRRHPNELGHLQARALIDELMRFPKPPMLVITGGDPLKRPDCLDLVRHAVEQGLITSMVPSATPLITRPVLVSLKEAGLSRLGISIDGADADTHDALRGIPGTFDRAVEICKAARDIGLPLQVNTTITRHNVGQVDAMADLVADLGVVLWSVFFLVPCGRAHHEPRITPQQYEQVFEQLWEQMQRRSFGIKTTEAPFWRRFVLQRHGDPQRGAMRAPLGVNDGKGILFISHTGHMQPSGFLPKALGRFPDDSIVQTYQTHPLLLSLRDPDQLHGKCGRCGFRDVCGGSRARAYALTGDPLAAEPDCLFEPGEAEGLTPGRGGAEGARV